ncbi:MAG: hypothetical protein CFE32_08620 [Alphaproteobacteria bacterium PA3]|nr:MAG: hypothetical protein CFE32_08620 [Alphaproteobacteria bacterium PA3]
MQIDADYEDLERQVNSYLDHLIADRKSHGWLPDQARECFFTACDFLEGSKRCLTPVQVNEVSVRAPQTTAIVTLSFSCELFIKAQLIHEKNPGMGHDLEQLFDRSKKDFQDAVSNKYLQRTNRNSKELLSDIAAFKKSFVEWRYLYDVEKRYNIRLFLLLSFAQSLFDGCLLNDAGWNKDNEDWYEQLRSPLNHNVLVSAHESGVQTRSVMTIED